jgi:hypothetical protein
MLSVKTTSGKISWTMVTNWAFLILWLATQIAAGFGYASYTPPAEAVVIAPALLAIINLLLRRYHTTEPLA